MTGAYWVSCKRFTVLIEVDDGIIFKAAPIVRRFIGQRRENLFKWFKGFGGFKYKKLKGY